MNKPKTPFLRFSALAIALMVAVVSCNDDDDDSAITQEEEMTALEQSTIAENSIDEESEVFESLALNNTGGRQKADCATITRDTVAKKITIEFEDGCVGKYGRVRSGKIIITYGGAFDDQQANRVITFDNYFVNNRQITGTVELKNINRSDEGFLTATRTLTGYTVTFADGNNIVLNGSTTREWIEGEGDGIRGNEVIRITGSYTGSTSRGRTFTRTITEPVLADFSCRASGGFLRTTGTHELNWTNIKGSRSRVVNYGTGNCDNEITVTINGTSRTITISE